MWFVRGVTLVVRFFIGTHNRLVALHSTLIKTHEETDISPDSVIYRPIGSCPGYDLSLDHSVCLLELKHLVSLKFVQGPRFRLRYPSRFEYPTENKR
jgi:hypothetical protein